MSSHHHHLLRDRSLMLLCDEITVRACVHCVCVCMWGWGGGVIEVVVTELFSLIVVMVYV